VTVSGKVQETPCSQGSKLRTDISRTDFQGLEASIHEYLPLLPSILILAAFVSATGVRLDAALMSTDQPERGQTEANGRRLPLMWRSCS
jgi:hypothetical protein